MKGKNIVLTVAVVAACAGVAMAAPNVPQAKAVKSNMTPTRLVPTAICPIYMIDGVEVQGEFVPYVDRGPSPALANRQVVWDAYDGDENNATAYPPIDRGGPCGGAGFLYTANTDSSSSDYFHVRVAHAADDYKGLDPAGVGQFVAGMSFLWNHVDATENVYHVFFVRDGFNETNSPTFGAAGGRARVQSGATFVGLGVTYGGAIGAGYYYVDIDWIDTVPAISPTVLADLEGSMSVRLFRNGTASLATELSFKDQVSTWGTRADELPAPSSLPRPGGVQTNFLYIDDAGALGSAPYVLANAVANGNITPAGADGGPNETYTTGPSTDPLDCFRVTGLSWAMWIKTCQAQDAATLVTPADGATGVTNNFPGPSFEWAPGATIATDYSCKIYQNNAVVHTMNGILTTTFDLDIALAPGCYEWSMVSNAGGLCPGTESARNEFAMVGSDCNPPCAADFNGDTVVDFFDYLDFVDAFSANDPSADFNGDTVIDFFDYLDFVDAFSTGCP